MAVEVGQGDIRTTVNLAEPDGTKPTRDIVEVCFSGAFEDGTPLEANIVCELQNAF